jgi:hypothetical protein
VKHLLKLEDHYLYYATVQLSYELGTRDTEIIQRTCRIIQPIVVSSADKRSRKI